MTPPVKPEWIEIADNDNAASPRKVAKKIPAAVLALAVAIIGAGAIFGQTAEESPANAVETLAPASTQSSASQQSTPESNSASVQTVAATSTIKNPSIATMPTGGDDDDEDGFEGDEGEDD